MSSETPFRVALLVVMSLTISVVAYHRWQAASSGERISHKDEGYLFAITLRLAGLGLWVSAFTYLLFPASIQWATIPLAVEVRWCGVVLGGLCPILMVWTLTSLGKNLTDTVVTRAAATLITNGPYRWIRHPFYATTALLLASVTLLSANWLIGLSSFAVMALLTVRTPNEERKLIEKFGDGYRRYIARTGRFLPRIGR